MKKLHKIIEQLKGNKYKVESGDNYSVLQEDRGTTVDAIMEANGLQTPDIQVGQILLIP